MWPEWSPAITGTPHNWLANSDSKIRNLKRQSFLPTNFNQQRKISTNKTERIGSSDFELCYYLGIEFCIANQLQTFEPGAQGEHKIARGFLPTRTHSRHYLVNESFDLAVRNALVHEAHSREAYYGELMEHSPYAPTRPGP